MAQHRIRLRAAWTCQLAVRDETIAATRLDLPCGRLGPQPGPIRLQRRFQSPRLDADRESVTLRLERVGGLRRVWLNGEPLAELTAGENVLEVPLNGRLRERNWLVLEVETRCAVESPWGEIALVIDRPEPDETLADPRPDLYNPAALPASGQAPDPDHPGE